MGTAAVVMWAVIYYGVHEINVLLPKYAKYLPRRRLRRYINNM